jgi:hypothetical protein
MLVLRLRAAKKLPELVSIDAANDVSFDQLRTTRSTFALSTSGARPERLLRTISACAVALAVGAVAWNERIIYRAKDVPARGIRQEHGAVLKPAEFKHC